MRFSIMLRERITKIYSYRGNLWKIAFSRVKAKYSNAFLGVFWAVVNPLLLMLVITFVFTFIFKAEIKNFPLFVLAGIIPWMFFSSSLFDAAGSIINQRGLLQQFNIPKEIFPISVVLANFLEFIAGFCTLYFVFLFFNFKIISLVPFLFIVLFLHFLFICGISLMLSVLNVVYRDITHFLGVMLMIWFWITPIFYSSEMLPEQLRWVISINPMSCYIQYYRDVIFNGNLPSISIFAGTFLWAIVSLILGFKVFSYFEKELFKKL